MGRNFVYFAVAVEGAEGRAPFGGSSQKSWFFGVFSSLVLHECMFR